jgi:membrane dipeptidase
MIPAALPVFDGHNDTLLHLYLHERGHGRSFFERSGHGHIDLPRAREGGFGGGFFAAFVPAGSSLESDPADLIVTDQGYEVRMEGPLDHERAVRVTTALMASLFRLEASSGGQLKVVRTSGELAACLRDGTLAAILHLEGAEAIDPELHALEVYDRAGLRSLGIVWSRPNIFGHGVPFMFPHSPDTGPGLTATGRDLVRACNRLGIMLDLSHLNERGFWDVAELSTAPLVATHSNVHALCPVARNLTDRQLDAIGESDGMVGVAFDVSMLRRDGGLDAETPLSEIVRHIEYIAERIGIERVGFGSDFDGATVPCAMADVTGLPALLAAFQARGYDDAALRKLAHENWLRVLRRTWRE